MRSRFSINKPLSLPTSKVVIRCYASHGKGFGNGPTPFVPIRILAINSARQTFWGDGHVGEWPDGGMKCPSLASWEWKCLCWMYADGSLPLGELDSVDPLLAQFDNLGPAHCEQFQGHGIEARLLVSRTTEFSSPRTLQD